MTESIKQRTNSMANHRDAEAMRKLTTALLADVTNIGSGLLYGTAVYNAASLADGEGVTFTIPVPGAVMGDFVVSVSAGVSLAAITLTGYVSQNGIVSVRLQNESTGTLDLASTTFRAIVLPRSSAAANAGLLMGAATYNPASLVNAAGATTTIAVKGAALGDIALVSNSIDLQGITTTAYVSATNVVSVRFQNETGGTIDLASATLRCRVFPEASFARCGAVSELPGHLQGTATYDAASTVDAAGLTTTITVTGAAVGDFAIGSLAVDLAGITATYYVSAADTVTARLQNESGGTLDLASADFNCRVIPFAALPISSTLNTIA